MCSKSAASLHVWVEILVRPSLANRSRRGDHVVICYRNFKIVIAIMKSIWQPGSLLTAELGARQEINEQFGG
jgi:hypothetical protein